MRHFLIGTLLLMGSLTVGPCTFGELDSQAGDVEGTGSETDNQPECGQTSSRAITGSAVSAKRLIGIPVTNPIGEEIGQVYDLVVDRCGKITHLVVEVGGFMGFGGRNVRVEMRKVRIRSLDHSATMVALVRETREHMLNRERRQDPEGKRKTTSSERAM